MPQQPGHRLAQIDVVQALVGVAAGGQHRHLRMPRPARPGRRSRKSRARNGRPSPARSTLGDQQNAVPALQYTWPMPAAAALRRIEPTLPGSCRLSSRTADSLSGPASARAAACRSGTSGRRHARPGSARRTARPAARCKCACARLAARHDVGHFRIGQRAFADDALQRHAAQLQVALAQMHAIEQGAAGLAPRLRAAGQLLEFLVQRIVARGDRSSFSSSVEVERSVRSISPASATHRRDTSGDAPGETPCTRRRSRCSAVGSPCAGRSRTADRAGAAPPGRVARGLGQDRGGRNRMRPCRRRSTMAWERIVMTGQRLPSIRASVGTVCKRFDRAPHRQHGRLQDIDGVSISSFASIRRSPRPARTS